MKYLLRKIDQNFFYLTNNSTFTPLYLTNN